MIEGLPARDLSVQQILDCANNASNPFYVDYLSTSCDGGYPGAAFSGARPSDGQGRPGRFQHMQWLPHDLWDTCGFWAEPRLLPVQLPDCCVPV